MVSLPKSFYPYLSTIRRLAIMGNFSFKTQLKIKEMEDNFIIHF